MGGNAMKRAVLGMAVWAAGSAAVMAAEVAPTDVKITEDGAVEMSLTGVPGDPANGRMIVSSKKRGNCVACHANDDMPDVPFQGNIGPDLTGAGDRWSEAQLRGLLVNAKATFDETMMPAFYKTDGFIRPGKAYTGKAADDTFGPLLDAQEIEDVVAYLLTLKE